MSNIEFNEEYKSNNQQPSTGVTRPSGIVGLLIKMRIARDTATANYILVAVASVAFTLSIIIFWNTFLEMESGRIEQPPPISKSEVTDIIKGVAPNITDSMLEYLPEKFYREDIPQNLIDALPSDLIKSVPSRQ